MLFYQRHKKLGVKGWELRKTIGSDYPQVLSILNTYLKPLDLKVKTLFEKEKYIEKPTSQQLDRARFFITLRGELKAKEIKMILTPMTRLSAMRPNARHAGIKAI